MMAVKKAGVTGTSDDESLTQGLECHLVMVNGKKEELLTAQQILRDADIENSTTHLTGQSVGDALIRYAEENAVDLIVMGAYGHSGCGSSLSVVIPPKCCKRRNNRFLSSVSTDYLK